LRWFRAAGWNPETIRAFDAIRPYIMLSHEKLANVYQLAAAAERNRIDGAFVECGVWRGGCAALMAFVSKRAQSRRVTWLCASFEGLPEPTAIDGDLAVAAAGGR